jgi:hypothetical protein
MRSLASEKDFIHAIAHDQRIRLPDAARKRRTP